MRILVPQGIGDSAWCLLKVQDLVRKLAPGPIDLRVACWHKNATEARAIPFLQRFSFVNSAELYVMPRNGNQGPVLLPGQAADSYGIYRYIPDGPPYPKLLDIDFVMSPNAPLERGIRLEWWLPGLELNWDIMSDYQFADGENAYADRLADGMGPYVVFFMASLANNTTAGHNRNALWTPYEWVELGERIHEKYGVQIVVVGTTWDEDYYAQCVQPMVAHKLYWNSYISRWSISQTLAAVRRARFVVSYQSGIGIAAHYMNVPTAIFWRPKGDSITPHGYISFEEGMASAWARPADLATGRLMPCIYGRHRLHDIIAHADRCGW